MNITINGKITNALTPRRGTSKAGNEWVSQDFVIETDNDEKICFNMFGEDRIKESGLRVGATASVTVGMLPSSNRGKSSRETSRTALPLSGCFIITSLSRRIGRTKNGAWD